MNQPRFYCREALAPGAHIDLPEPVARHAVRVLRLPPGAAVVLFDGRGGEYEARIERIEKDRVVAALGAWSDVERESPLAVTLIQAVQAGEKMDFTIQKAVELGVSAIVPVDSRRSVTRLSGERAGRRVAHWQGVAAAACEQCGRNRLPLIEEPMPLERWLAMRTGAPGLVLHTAESNPLARGDAPAQLRLLVGPEGGLEDNEFAQARAAGFTPWSLGPRVLRADTAPLAALAVLAAALQAGGQP